jgi:hypothetical protein
MSAAVFDGRRSRWWRYCQPDVAVLPMEELHIRKHKALLLSRRSR